MNKRVSGTAALIAVAALTLAGCAGGDGSGGDEGSPIVVGSVNTISGPATFPEASLAALSLIHI